MAQSTQQGVLFEGAFTKPVWAQFDAEALTSDGGMALLVEADHALGLTEALAAEIRDPRQAGKIDHGIEEVLRQRVFSIAAGYEDGTDAARLGADPALKLACGREPVAGADLASQPTISRFENRVTPREVVAMNRRLEDTAVRDFRRRYPNPGRITIDLDPTVDPTHGEQQGTLFNGFYGTWCYLPVLGFLSSSQGRDQHLFFARLRPGTSKEVRGVIPTLRRVVASLRDAYGRKLNILVRLDTGFFNPMLLAVLDELGVKYVVGMPSNKKLKRWSNRRQPTARRLARETKASARLFDERMYQTRSWPKKRRVILKAEAIPYPGRELKNNPRFVVTNLTWKAKRVYLEYCGRGDPENRIKELKLDLAIDRTSCTSFVANQFRVTMTAAAYLLYQELRWQLRDTALGRAQVKRLRTVLIKAAARVAESVRRIVFHLPAGYAFEAEWKTAARALGGRTPRPAT